MLSASHIGCGRGILYKMLWPFLTSCIGWLRLTPISDEINHNSTLQFRPADLAIWNKPELFFRVPSSPRIFQLLSQVHFGKIYYHGDNVLISKWHERIPRLFLYYDFDRLQSNSPVLIVSVPNIEQCLAVFFNQILCTLLTRFKVQSRFHALPPCQRDLYHKHLLIKNEFIKKLLWSILP